MTGRAHCQRQVAFLRNLSVILVYNFIHYYILLRTRTRGLLSKSDPFAAMPDVKKDPDKKVAICI